MDEIRYSQQNIFCRKALEKRLKYVLENIIYIRYFIRGKWNLPIEAADYDDDVFDAATSLH